jgi:hypothetical protein
LLTSARHLSSESVNRIRAVAIPHIIVIDQHNRRSGETQPAHHVSQIGVLVQANLIERNPSALHVKLRRVAQVASRASGENGNGHIYSYLFFATQNYGINQMIVPQ